MKRPVLRVDLVSPGPSADSGLAAAALARAHSGRGAWRRKRSRGAAATRRGNGRCGATGPTAQEEAGEGRAGRQSDFEQRAPGGLETLLPEPEQPGGRTRSGPSARGVIPPCHTDPRHAQSGEGAQCRRPRARRSGCASVAPGCVRQLRRAHRERGGALAAAIGQRVWWGALEAEPRVEIRLARLWPTGRRPAWTGDVLTADDPPTTDHPRATTVNGPDRSPTGVRALRAPGGQWAVRAPALPCSARGLCWGQCSGRRAGVPGVACASHAALAVDQPAP